MLRRDLLRAGLGLGALAALPTWTSRATADGPAAPASPPRNLLVVLAYGGWDTTCVLDAKPRGSARVDVADGEPTRIGEITVRTHASRPNVRTFFERFGALTAVVNGVQVRSIAHEECVKRILTGTPSTENADVAARAAFELGRDLPVPYLVLGPIAMSGPLGAIVGRTGSVNQLRSLVLPDGEYPPPTGKSALRRLTPSEAEEAMVRRYMAASASREQAVRGQHGANAKALDDFRKSLDRESLLRRFVKENGGFGDFAYTPDIAVQSEIAVRALQRGLSRSVMLGGGFDWDTHDDNARQSDLQDRLYGNLATLGGMLEREGLLATTTVLVVSEMGRTPKLNLSRGKDHWPVTSALVFGAGVKGNRVVGGTDDGLGALSVDLKTGSPERGGTQIQSANLAAAVLKMVGVDAAKADLGAEALDAIVA